MTIKKVDKSKENKEELLEESEYDKYVREHANEKINTK